MAPSPTPSARSGAVRGAGLTLLALAGFALVSSVLRAFVPPPTECYLRAKLEHYERTREEFDVVCIGSSQIFRSIVPAILDGELAAGGREWSTFNLGVPGMLGFETDYYLARVLERPAARLKLVVLELRGWVPGISERSNTRRAAYWHDLEQTRRAVRYATALPLAAGERWQHAGAHLRMGALRQGNIGLGVLFFEALLGLRPAPDPMDPSELATARGYRPTERDQPERAAEFRRNYHVFERLISVLAEGSEPPTGPNAAELELLRWRSRAVKRAGVELVYVLPPVATQAPFRHSDWDGELPPVFAYNRPLEHPELYAAESRADRPHLSERGALSFSRTFGAELAEYLATDPARRH